MAILQLTKVLEDRIVSLEQDVKASLNDFSKRLSDLNDKIDSNFRFQFVLIVFGCLPTLQSLGIPTKEFFPVLTKIVLKFIGG